MEITPWKMRRTIFIHELSSIRKRTSELSFLIHLNEWIKIVQSIFYGVICLFYWYWDFFVPWLQTSESTQNDVEATSLFKAEQWSKVF